MSPSKAVKATVQTPRGQALIVAMVTLGLALTVLPLRAEDANQAKAHALVKAAIQMTDSQAATKMLWQATDVDPTSSEAYIYLGLYYNSREDFAKVIEVYKKMVKYRPKEASAYLNIGEAYMSFSPPRYVEALPYYQKAYEVDPTSAFAALRIGELLAHEGKRDQAVFYLKKASSGAGSNPGLAAEADKVLKELGS